MRAGARRSEPPPCACASRCVSSFASLFSSCRTPQRSSQVALTPCALHHPRAGSVRFRSHSRPSPRGLPSLLRPPRHAPRPGACHVCRPSHSVPHVGGLRCSCRLSPVPDSPATPRAFPARSGRPCGPPRQRPRLSGRASGPWACGYMAPPRAGAGQRCGGPPWFGAAAPRRRLDPKWTPTRDSWPGLEGENVPLCGAFVRVSDGTRTRDRLDHNQDGRGQDGSYSAPECEFSSDEVGSVSLKLDRRLDRRANARRTSSASPAFG